jgi:hypothetical protein
MTVKFSIAKLVFIKNSNCYFFKSADEMHTSGKKSPARMAHFIAKGNLNSVNLISASQKYLDLFLHI